MFFIAFLSLSVDGFQIIGEYYTINDCRKSIVRKSLFDKMRIVCGTFLFGVWVFEYLGV